MKTQHPELISNQNPAVEILKKAYSRAQSKNPRFSLRALAKKANLSHSHISRIFAGERQPTAHILPALFDALQMDDIQKSEYYKKWIKGKLKEQAPTAIDSPHQPNSQFENEDYILLEDDSRWLLSRWYHFVLLDALKLKNFNYNPEALARALGIEVQAVVSTYKTLKEMGLVSEDSNGNMVKVHRKIRFANIRSKDFVRAHHISQMRKAILELESKKTVSDFEQRLITGFTFTGSSEKREQAIQYLHECLFKAVELMTDPGPCDEVYQLNIQFFPQIRKNELSKP